MDVNFYGYSVHADTLRKAQMILRQAEREFADGDIDKWFYAGCPVGRAYKKWWLEKYRSPWPWFTEPQHLAWIDEATGLPCVLARNPYLGCWNGYVGLLQSLTIGSGYESLIDCHGGITYSNVDLPVGQRNIPPGLSQYAIYWIGFDCGHAGDMRPLATFINPGGEYRTVEYARNECVRIAAQLIGAHANSKNSRLHEGDNY